jgi:hypothetical protein
VQGFDAMLAKASDVELDPRVRPASLIKPDRE